MISNVEKLAQVLQAEDESGLELLRLMQLQLFSEDDTNTITSNIPKTEKNETGFHAIGTWHPAKQGEEILFKRVEQADSVFWESTCDLFPLRKKENVKRVCFIGESVAAGMFFTPAITPAKVLSNYLEVNSEDSWEVMDLTRNCMNAGALIETCSNSLQLDPDYIVIVAGNNWFSDIMVEHNGALSRRKKYANSIDKNGLSGVIETYQQKAKKLAKTIMTQMNRIAADNKKTKFIFAIPALNYFDWERRVPLHWLNNERTLKWYEYYRLAIESYDIGKFENALELGKKMYELDEGHNSTSSRIIANCYIALGKNEEAYKYFAAETDYSLIFDEITSFPAVSSFIRREYDEHNTSCPNIEFINLEKILIEYDGISALGKKVFVDYCHLNPEGFHIVMAPIASSILNRTDVHKQKRDWTYLMKNTPFLETDSSALAVSYFCAALYNSHLNRSVTDDLDIEKYCALFQKAVACDPSVLDIMELYVKARSCAKGSGFTLSKAGQKFFELMNSPLDFPVAQEAPGVDALTIEAICRSLENHGYKGDQLRKDYQSPYIKALDRGVDLTEPAYIEWINSHIRMAMDSENGTRRMVPFYKSWWPSSFFSLVADGEQDLKVELTCRLPIGNHQQSNTVKIFINNHEVGRMNAGTVWTKQSFLISSKVIKKGFNRVSIEWPLVQQYERQKLLELKHRYNKGLSVDFFPVFGEVHSFIVQICKDNQN